MNRKILFFCVGVLMISAAKAQYYQTGQDPSLIKWKQINTNDFQVIYPQDIEKQAQRLTFVLEKVYDYGRKTLNARPHKISVVLHSRTAVSNGLVAWAPKRMELFTTPNQQIYSQDWIEQLALHEFRHVVQMDKIQTELPSLLKIILGEQATALVTGIYVPYWFLEGDAVVTETALSNTGRGRTSGFTMPYRARLIEKGKFSFDKAYLGSYKDFVDNYYSLGYFLVGESRKQYGPEIWTKTLGRIADKPLSITPLNTSIKAVTGKSIKQLYNSVFDQLTMQWKADGAARKTDRVNVDSPVKKKYTNYLYPYTFGDTQLFAYRTSINDLGRFVLINPDKTERVIYTPGIIYDESVSLTENWIIWSEERSDLRWTHAEHTVIRLYNIKTKKIKEIKPRNHLFCPVLSPDLKTFAAVEVDHENNYSLSIFDLNGNRIKQFKTSDNQYFITPSWDKKGEKLYAVSLSETGKCLISINLKNGQIIELTERTYANMKNPVPAGDRIIFSADFSGIDQIYALNPDTKDIVQLVSVPFGANYPAVSKTGKTLYFSNYNSNGYHLASIELQNDINIEKITSIKLINNSLADKLSSQEKGIPDFSKTDTIKYKSSEYSKFAHLFHFHSWSPLFIDVNNYEIRPGVSLLSQNLLGTAITQLGYDYNVSDKTGKYKLSFGYSGWFPEISATFSYGGEASHYYLISNTLNQLHQIVRSDTTLERFTWKKFDADFDIRLPLNLSKGKYSRIFYPEFLYSLVHIQKTDESLKNLYPASYNAFTYRIYAYNLMHQTNQNLMPRLGQSVDIIYRHTPLNNNGLGTLWGIQTNIYLPGVLKNDGFNIYQGYQSKTFPNRNSGFDNFVKTPRGFSSYTNNQMYSLAANYKLPIGYPDFSLGKLAYFKRIKSNLFYDYAWLSVPTWDKSGTIYPNSLKKNLKSFGTELTSDLHILRFYAPFEMGLRVVYRPDYNDFQYNFLISINFSGI